MSRQKSDTSLVSIIVFTVSIVIIISLVKSAFEFRGARSRLAQTQQDMQALEAAQQDLARQVQLAQDPASLELSIRDKLNVARPEETVVIVSEDSLESNSTSPTAVSTADLPPYIQWWRLLTSRD